MPREHARILCSVWQPGDDFRQRSPEAQRLYFLLLSQRELNNAGLLPLMVNKWARLSTGTTAEDIEVALKELTDHRYVLVDDETEEVLIRSFARNDGVAKQPNVLKNCLRLAQQIESVRLRSALAHELVRIGHPDTVKAARDLDPEAVPSEPRGTPPEGLPKPSAEPQSNPSAGVPNKIANTPAGMGRGKGKGGSSASRGGWGGGNDPAPRPNLDPDNPRCAQHADIPATDRGPDCRACAAVRRQLDDQAGAQPDAAAAERAARRAAIDECDRCDPNGMRDTESGALARCDHVRAEASR